MSYYGNVGNQSIMQKMSPCAGERQSINLKKQIKKCILDLSGQFLRLNCCSVTLYDPSVEFLQLIRI